MFSLGVIPVLAAGSLLGMLGIYWDIAWHIDFGRDTFFSPPHLLLYASMLSVLLMGLYGLVRDRRDTRYHLRLGNGRLHPGVLVVATGALMVLVFAPFDELWHRLFGPGATLWGPMHLIGIFGLSLGSVGGLITTAIERQISPGAGASLKERRSSLPAPCSAGWCSSSPNTSSPFLPDDFPSHPVRGAAQLSAGADRPLEPVSLFGNDRCGGLHALSPLRSGLAHDDGGA